MDWSYEFGKMVYYIPGLLHNNSRTSDILTDVPVFLVGRNKGADIALFKVLPSHAAQHNVPHVRLDQLYVPPPDKCERAIPIWTGGYCGNDAEDEKEGKGTKFLRYLQDYKAILPKDGAEGIDWVSHLQY